MVSSETVAQHTMNYYGYETLQTLCRLSEKLDVCTVSAAATARDVMSHTARSLLAVHMFRCSMLCTVLSSQLVFVLSVSPYNVLSDYSMSMDTPPALEVYLLMVHCVTQLPH